MDQNIQVSFGTLALRMVILGCVFAGPAVFFLMLGYKIIGGILAGIAIIGCLFYTENTVRGLLTFMIGFTGAILVTLALLKIFGGP